MGVTPIGVNTDCILIRETQNELNKKATKSNITSEIFTIKTTHKINKVKQSSKICKQYLSP